MNEPVDHNGVVERLQRRLAREKSARLQAEAIAERVASDRWELRKQLEDKLALRTAELQAARRAASELLTVRRRGRAARTHTLRTTLTALFYFAESLTESEPLRAAQIAELRRLLADMQAVLDSQAGGSAAPADVGPPSEALLPDIIAALETGWHQVAARGGKLLLLDIDVPPGPVPSAVMDEADDVVLGAIRERLGSPEPVIELRLSVGPGGLTAR